MKVFCDKEPWMLPKGERSTILDTYYLDNYGTKVTSIAQTFFATITCKLLGGFVCSSSNGYAKLVKEKFLSNV